MGKKQKAKAEQQAQKKHEEGRQIQNGIKPGCLDSADEKVLAECEHAARDFANGSRFILTSSPLAQKLGIF
jgi:hypothetical protein